MTGSGATAPDAGRARSTASRTWRPSGSALFSGTVSTPHVIVGAGSTAGGHGAAAYVGVYAGAASAAPPVPSSAPHAAATTTTARTGTARRRTPVVRRRAPVRIRGVRPA